MGIMNDNRNELVRYYKRKMQNYKGKIWHYANEIEKMKKNLPPEDEEQQQFESTSGIMNSEHLIKVSFDSTTEGDESPQIFKNEDEDGEVEYGISPQIYKTPKRFTNYSEQFFAQKENFYVKNNSSLDDQLIYQHQQLNQLKEENQKLKEEIHQSKNLKAFHAKQKMISQYEDITQNYVDLIDMYKNDDKKNHHFGGGEEEEKNSSQQKMKQEIISLRKCLVEKTLQLREANDFIKITENKLKNQAQQILMVKEKLNQFKMEQDSSSSSSSKYDLLKFSNTEENLEEKEDEKKLKF